MPGESRLERSRSEGHKAAQKWPEIIGGAIGAAVGVGIPFWLGATTPLWLVLGTVVGVFLGATVPPAWVFLVTAVTYQRFLLEERVSVLEARTRHTTTHAPDLTSTRHDSSQAREMLADLLVGGDRLVRPTLKDDSVERQKELQKWMRTCDDFVARYCGKPAAALMLTYGYETSKDYSQPLASALSRLSWIRLRLKDE
jgi:hypothetical protein